LKGAQGVLSQVSISLLILKYPNKCFYKISFLKQVASSKALVAESIDKSHGVFEDPPVALEQQFVDDFALRLRLLVIAIQQVVVHVSVDHLL
jgi:hypothetical protein